MEGGGEPEPPRRSGRARLPALGDSGFEDVLRGTPFGSPLRGQPHGSPKLMLDVHLDSWLREFGPRGRERIEADSVEHLLDELEARYPRLRFKIRDETGQIRRYVRVFVDGEDVSGTTGVSTPLVGVRAIDILHSIAGG